MIFFDYIIIILIYIIVFMILCGYYSLCERKILAAFQLRVGPGLFLAGILTPITDGIKLLFKNAMVIISVDIVYLLINLSIVLICMFTAIFFFPIGYIMICDINCGMFAVVALHLGLNITGVYIMGCYMFTSCYVYLASMRTLYFSILGEACIYIVFLVTFSLDTFSFYSLKELSICQLFIENIWLLGLLFSAFTCIIILIDGLKLPFDYVECESELVAGLVTEFSGFFFVIYSLVEINHALLNAIALVCFLFGGYYICFKSLFIITFVFLIPRSLSCRMKLNHTQILIVNYIYILGFIFILHNVIIKIILINF